MQYRQFGQTGRRDRIWCVAVGRQLFAIDQQPWLQGFLAVSMSDAYVNFGTATAPVLTGPGIVDAANVDATIAGAAAGFR
jgi:simple sugar transport system substrate-binding protein